MKISHCQATMMHLYLVCSKSIDFNKIMTCMTVSKASCVRIDRYESYRVKARAIVVS